MENNVNNMEREIIKMSDVYSGLQNGWFYDDEYNDLYELVQSNVELDDIDLDDGLYLFTIVFKRKLDNKYFKVSSTYDTEIRNDRLWKKEATEVFSYEETIINYK